jgi:hypothetical protein
VAVANGKVVGGQYMNAMVMLTPRGQIVLQVPLKFRKVPLNADTVTKWEEELTSETRGGAAGAVGAVGQAVAGAVLPGLVGKMASAAIGSTIDSTMRPPRNLRIGWADGQQSLIELPEKLFRHLAVVLKDRQVVPVAPMPVPAVPTSATAAPSPAAHPDVTEQIAKLAALRDQGILTEDEFATKKGELLARL